MFFGQKMMFFENKQMLFLMIVKILGRILISEVYNSGNFTTKSAKLLDEDILVSFFSI